MADDFTDKLAEMRNSVENIRNAIGEKSPSVKSCIPVTMMVAIAVPFLLLILLYAIQPSFVQKKDGKKYVRSGGKVILWTIILTAVVWLGMYLFTFCKGYAAKKLCWN